MKAEAPSVKAEVKAEGDGGLLSGSILKAAGAKKKKAGGSFAFSFKKESAMKEGAKRRKQAAKDSDESSDEESEEIEDPDDSYGSWHIPGVNKMKKKDLKRVNHVSRQLSALCAASAMLPSNPPLPVANRCPESSLKTCSRQSIAIHCNPLLVEPHRLPRLSEELLHRGPVTLCTQPPCHCRTAAPGPVALLQLPAML